MSPQDTRNLSGEPKRCPFCGSGTERRGASNRLGTQSVTWIRCKSCPGFNTEGAGWDR